MRPETWFLSSGGAAQSAAGDGKLVLAPPGREPSDVLYHDPYTPVPPLPRGADRGPVQLREDVLCWTSGPLPGPVPAGAAEAVLRLRIPVAEGRLLVALTDVRPDGQVLALALAEAVCTGPAAARELRVQLACGYAEFAPGHRIRLELSALGRPRYGADPAPLNAPAVYRVHHDTARPSRLVLGAPL
ncbi:CocE/NonD family hydrolase C-terminal non-catalytic domain-containing protein [Streptomyces orinoci]|uniref:CocE/NonD family hydrolase C-terminal non-catalytic domain-containing protein n=1 Tax=Streptomyces orinoci TaxID=67339 RepID=A0ABV3JT91_STRON|nr:CocE/NonD family hydrolase C-terminal non-catalytic domain-containing protein [Streptomyces orinoci]